MLAVTSEYSSGMIRATLAAAPGRVRLALAKAAVLAAAVLLIGEVLAFVTFFASEAMLHAPVPGPPWPPRGRCGRSCWPAPTWR